MNILIIKHKYQIMHNTHTVYINKISIKRKQFNDIKFTDPLMNKVFEFNLIYSHYTV